MKEIIIFFYSAKSTNDVKRILTNDYDHINNISKHFDEIWILNLSNLKIIQKKVLINNKILKKYNYNKNIFLKNPLNFSELKKLLNQNHYNGIVCLQVSFENFILYYYLKKL